MSPQVGSQLESVASGQITGQGCACCQSWQASTAAATCRDRQQLKHRDSSMADYLQPALAAGLIEMTQLDKPHNSKQRYRLTKRGLALQVEKNKQAPEQ